MNTQHIFGIDIFIPEKVGARWTGTGIYEALKTVLKHFSKTEQIIIIKKWKALFIMNIELKLTFNVSIIQLVFHTSFCSTRAIRV